MKKKQIVFGCFVGLIIFLLVSFLGCASNEKKIKSVLPMDSNIVSGILENGMTYQVVKNEIPANRIQMRLVVKAGSLMEEDDQKGIAHLIEHMAFNGSENFSKNEIIDFFELVGMKFGNDLNAYTSFEETVYMLEIPADDIKIFETAMLILKDWASGLIFEEEELNKERGVIVEEWRVRDQGVAGRVSDARNKVFFEGSLYNDRLPIGDMDIIKNISRERVKDFYEKWYRPDLMSVVIVGDIKPEEAVKGIQETMADIPRAEDMPEKPSTTIPEKSEKVSIIRDSEQSYPLVYLFEMQSSESLSTIDDLREYYESLIVASILNMRLSEIKQNSDSPWIDVVANNFSLTHEKNINYLGFVPKDGNFEVALKTIIDEMERFRKYGVLQSELDRVKESFYTTLMQAKLNKDKRQSSDIIASLVNNCISGSVVLSPEDNYDISMAILKDIDVKDILAAATNLFDYRGQILEVLIPESYSIPSETALMNIWQNYIPENLTAYNENGLKTDWLITPTEKGSIISKEVIPGEEGIIKYVLSNGATVLAKITDYDVNKVHFKFVSPGGFSLVKDEDIPSAAIASTYVAYSGANGVSRIECEKLLAGKQISFNSYISDYSEGFVGMSATSDFETLMQLLYVYFTKPNFSDDAWKMIYDDYSMAAKNRSSNPMNVFTDEMIKAVYGDDIRKSSLSPDFVSKLDASIAEKIYKERFNNASDFTFVFVGHFQEAQLEDLITTYIGNLPGDETKKENAVWQSPKIEKYPEEKPTFSVYKGIDEQSVVAFVFTGELPQLDPVQEEAEADMLNILASLVEMKLRESIREEKGGSYSVNVSSAMQLYPERNYEILIQFVCEPSRVKELSDEVIVQIKKLQTELVDNSYITKLSENYRRSMEPEQLKDNSVWASMIAECVLAEMPFSVITNPFTVPPMINAENLKQLAEQYLNLNNYVYGYLMPQE